MSRTDNSLRNLKTAVLFKLAAIVVNFIARKIFVVVLTKEYLGLDGTFANILTMLSLAELGVGTAITYSMYKPCLLYTSPSPRDTERSRMPSSA